ncbi:putative transposase for the IS285 insertion element [Vibrio mimicus]|nr:putative transposase for the IS285 insertion element [Vibrio mimicus]
MFLAIQDASKKWTMPIRQALNRFVFMFEEQFTDYM